MFLSKTRLGGAWNPTESGICGTLSIYKSNVAVARVLHLLILWEPKTLCSDAGQLGSRAIGNTLEVVCQEVEADLKVEALR